MSDLVAFLRARLDEDEAGADSRAFPPDGYYNHDVVTRGFRALADIEAKRRIIDDAADAKRWDDQDPEALRYLAMPYADHEDYDPEWRI